MKHLLAVTFVLATSFTAGRATAAGSNWPIEPRVTYPPTAGPEGATAKVDVEVTDDATNVRVEVFGTGGLTLDNGNRLSLTIAALKRGQHFVFDVAFHPPRSRAAIVVQTRAKFGRAGEGGPVREFPFGAETPAPSRCVRQDPDGTWVRIMGCEDGPAQVTPETLSAQPPGVARVEGFVVGSYLCPPCPRGAQCKPCARASVIFVSGRKDHPPVPGVQPPADVAAIETEEVGSFAQGIGYRFEVRVGSTVKLLRSQRADEPAWTK